jgi:hypothetical protein
MILRQPERDKRSLGSRRIQDLTEHTATDSEIMHRVRELLERNHSSTPDALLDFWVAASVAAAER